MSSTLLMSQQHARLDVPQSGGRGHAVRRRSVKKVDVQSKAFAGAVAIATGLLIVAFVVGNDSEDPSTGSGAGPGAGPATDEAGLGCTLTASGAGLLAEALSRGRSPNHVLSLAGGAATGYGCNKVVSSLMNGQSAEVIVGGGSGTTATLSADQLLAPPPATAPPGAVAGDLDCMSYDTWWAFDLCWDGLIAPPVGS